MPLMERIKVRAFHTWTPAEQLEKITQVQKLRLGALEQARTKRGGKTRSAIKNQKARGIDPEAKAKAALGKLTPAQLAALTAKLGAK